MRIERGVVGRDFELAEIRDRLRAATSDGAAAVVVVGRAGMGKTALLRALTHDVPGTVRSARAVPWESDQPGAALRQLFPESELQDVVQESGGGPTALADRLALDDAPTLLLVDDADLADHESLQLITSVLQHHRDLPVLVVLSITRWNPLVRDLGTTVCRLEGLDARSIGELARRRGQVLPLPVADRLAGHVQGVPAHVVELLEEVPAGHWREAGSRLPAPRTVREDVEQRLARLDDDGRALVEAMAVLAEGEPFGVATQVASVVDPVLALDGVQRAGLLDRLRDGEPRLRDALTRAAILDLMGVEAFTSAHRRASAAALSEGAELQHLVLATLAPDASLAQRLADFAQRCGSDGEWAQAADLFWQASRLSEDEALREHRHLLSVDARIASGDGHGAATLIPSIEGLRETPLRNAVLAYLAIVRGRAAEAELRLRRAWEIVNPERDPAVAGTIAQRYVLHSLSRCGAQELVDWADRALDLVGPDSAAGIEAAAIRGLGVAAAGRPDHAHDDYAELSSRMRHSAQVGRVSLARGWLAGVRDDVDVARTFLEGTSNVALGGSARISLWALGWLARTEFRIGSWDSALETIDRGWELSDASGIMLATPLLAWTSAQVHCLRGDWAKAEEVVRHAERVAQGYEIMEAPAMLARAHLAEARADYAGAVRALEPLVALAPGTALDEPGFMPWQAPLANALVMQGEHERADAFLTEHEARAHERGHASSIASLAMCRGRLQGALGDLDGARASFDTALEVLRDTRLVYERARVTFAYGQTLRRAGRRREADEMLTISRDLWAGLGATTYVERCDAELKAGGVRVTRGPRDDTALTTQEEVVAELVASGLSNREVATRLYVSPKTVQYHLTRIYAKLGLRSRTELAAYRRAETEGEGIDPDGRSGASGSAGPNSTRVADTGEVGRP